MLKGLPASGKSTHAKELVKTGYKRVNKDDLRVMIDNGKWSQNSEKRIVEAQTAIVESYLAGNCNVVVDDTNFHQPHEARWRALAEKYKAVFEVKFFDTPLELCIERDATRGEKSVGEKVIRDMHKKYLEVMVVEKAEVSPVLPYCYIFDIDGTLAIMNGRSPYDWKSVGNDLPNEPIMGILRALVEMGKQSIPIYLVSGRDESCREETEAWLKFHRLSKGWDYADLYMRPAGDMRKDVLIKKEIYEREFKGKRNVLCVFDDRDQVVKFWREMGLTCLQVAEGNF